MEGKLSITIVAIKIKVPRTNQTDYFKKKLDFLQVEVP